MNQGSKDMRWHEMTSSEISAEFTKIRDDRDRWRDLAEHLCSQMGSVIVPDWIASRFPDPLPLPDYEARRG